MSLVVKAQAKSSREFENISVSFFTQNWRQHFGDLVTEVLEGDYLDVEYPNVTVELEIDKKNLIRLEVVNTKTDEKVQFLFLNGTGQYNLEENISYRLNAIGGDGEWTLNFMEGQFRSTLADFESDFSNRKGLCVDGSFKNISAVKKNKLIRSMVNKLALYFRYQIEYAPAKIMSVVCQALDCKPAEIDYLKISMGYFDVIELREGKIVKAFERNNKYTVILDSLYKAVTYSEKDFTLCEHSEKQSYTMEYKSEFASLPSEDDMTTRTVIGMDKIKKFLHEVALYNENQ